VPTVRSIQSHFLQISTSIWLQQNQNKRSNWQDLFL